MKWKRQVLRLLVALLVLVVLAGCSKSTAPVAEQKENSQPTTAQGDWWEKFGKPQYGGTMTFASPGLQGFSLDPYNFIGADVALWYDTLFEPDWTLSRDTWSFSTNFAPDQYWKGNLIESWEITDPQTITAKVRQGIHWQNKPPVNGREFTAEDIQFHYDRILGTGSGYTTPSPLYAGMTANWEKVTATDKYTVVFKFKQPSAQNFQAIVDRFALSQIEAPEWVALGGPPVNQPAPSAPGGPPAGGGPPPAPAPVSGPLGDWKQAVGTGPWMLTDYVTGSSLTYTKNPNYWGRDPRNPENQLPYADKLVMLIIPDVSTRMAALRTGKIDYIKDAEWLQATSLKKSNPEIQQSKQTMGAGGVQLKLDRAPFTDIRVRKALNMAIDRKAIAQSVFGGTSDGNPTGLITQSFKGVAYAYQDWPQALKDEFSYNPAKAKQLLAEAGFPNGFKTSVVTGSNTSTEQLQAFKAYFMDIGVDMEIKMMDSVSLEGFIRSGKTEQMSAAGAGITFPPTRTVDMYYSKSPDATVYGVNDPGYDALRDRFWSAKDAAEGTKATQELDKYFIEQHWVVSGPETYSYNLWQPYLKGYSGEFMGWGQQTAWSRLWIDQNAKKAAGR